MEDTAFQNWIDELNEVDMEDVCDQLGIEVHHIHGHKQILCPFHDDNHIGSCFITKKNYMYCYACKKNASNITLVQQELDVSFMEACEYISDMSGILKPEETRSNKNVRQMPFAIDKRQRERQLGYLGLRKSVSVLDVKEMTDDPVEKNAYADAYEPAEDGYLLGKYEKATLQQLFDADEVTFNYIVLGKLFYCLMDAIANYMASDNDFDTTKTLEQKIDDLMPIAKYYQNVAPYYGYRLDFVNLYKKKGAFRYQVSF